MAACLSGHGVEHDPHFYLMAIRRETCCLSVKS